MPAADAPDLAFVARALADDTRARMVLTLLDGRAWTAGELARHVGVAPSTATEHLHRLVDAGLLAEVRQGRHRYVRLADERVAALVEGLAATGPVRAPSRSLRTVRTSAELAAARTCYRHLAGALGVGLLHEWERLGLLTGWQLTAAGRRWFADLDIDWCGEREPLRPCLDWTQRRDHAAGALADALCAKGFDAGWWRRGSHPRSVLLTDEGRSTLTTAGLRLP